jgi:hypothetical protein
MANTTNQPDQLQFVDRSVLFDLGALDRAISTHGAKMIHWAAVPCPVGKSDPMSVRRPHADHSGCSNGFLYIKMGTVHALFINSGNKLDQYETGTIDGTTVTVTMPTTYDDSDNEVQALPFDRFFLDEENLTVPHTELFESSITGHDRLHYPIVKVITLIDNKGVVYCPDDYKIEDGQLVWTSRNPGYDTIINKGAVCSIRYLFRPFFYVDRISHQTRSITVDTGLECKKVRGPQELTLIREKVFEKEEKDDQAPNSQSNRQVKGPRATPLMSR